MPKSSESINNSLFDLLRSKGYNPTMLDTAGKEIPVPDEAEVFQFDFIKDEVNYGTVTISIDGLQKLTIYYNDSVANSKKHDNDETTGSSWYSLLKQLKKFAKSRQLGFELKNSNHLKHDMAKRDFMKQKNKISEGYYPMGKKASYSDSVPNVKIVIEHTRQIEEGEQRYRNINRIFLENQLGERFLLDTKKPGIARVYARHIAEGGKVNDERWGHINSLCEEYQKMAGFVRATRNGQFNESAQKLVNEGINHYQSLRETLSRMTGHRGYNMYFESWTPPLMEDETDTNAINELFVQETLDPRIESVMPILSKLHKQVAEMKEVSELSEWADSLLEGGDGGEASEEPTFTEPVDELPAGGNDAPEDNLDEGTEPTLDDVLARHSDAVEAFRQGGDMDYDLESDLWDYYFTSGDIKNYDADASEFLSQKLADHLGIDESLDESGLQAYLGNKKYGKEGMDALRKAGREHAGKEKMAKIRAKYDKLDEVELEEGMDVEKRGRLNDLIDQYRTATDPDDYYNDEGYDPDEVIAQIRSEFGDKIASQLEAGADKMHYPRPGHSDWKPDPLSWKKPVDRITKAGKMYKQDSDYMKNTIKSRYKLSGKSASEGVEEGLGDFAKKVGGALKSAGKKALDVISPDDEQQLIDLRMRAGLNNPEHGKPNMAKPNNEGVAEGMEGRVVFSGTGANGSKYEIIQTGPTDFMIHANGRHIDTYSSLQRAMGVLKNEVPGLQQGVEEGLDANQKRVGQLGPTEKVGPKGAVGKLVGANESVEQLGELKKSTVKSYADKKQAELDDVPPMPFKKPGMSKAEHEKAAKGMMGALARLSGKKPTSEGSLNEMDSEGYKGTRDDYEIGKGKEGKAKLVKPGEVAKQGADALNKAMDKEHKKDVKEGQEDLDYMLRIIKK